MAFSVQFSLRYTDPKTQSVRTEQYPHARKGQTGYPVTGVDARAVRLVRADQAPSRELRVTEKFVQQLADSLADGGRISAYEKPVYYAVMRAIRGEKVEITDSMGHWRRLTVTPGAAAAFKAAVKGVNIV